MKFIQADAAKLRATQRPTDELEMLVRAGFHKRSKRDCNKNLKDAILILDKP